MSPRLRATALLPLALFGSCAAVDREVEIKSSPSNVRVFEGGARVSATGPQRYKLDPSRDHDLRFEADCYEPQRIFLESTVSGLRVTVVVLETLFLPIIVLPILWPMWVATGYWYEFEPEEPSVTLVRIGGSTDSTPVAAPTPPVSRPTPPSSAPRPAPPAPPAPTPRPAPSPPPAPAPAPPPTPPPSPPPASSRPAPPSPPTSPSKPTFCGACGAPLSPSAKFCGGCGKGAESP